MTYLLDTDTLVLYLRGREDVRQKLLNVPLNELYTSSVCIGELYYGAAKSQRRAERKPDPLADYPSVIDGARGVRFIETTVKSAGSSQKWTDARWQP